MDKTPTATMNPKRANKPLKPKKKQPLKVVYITNPIKFTATASEFRALVQELTGRDAADVPDSSRFAGADGFGGGGGCSEAVKVADVHAQVGKVGQTHDELLQKGSDLSTFGGYDEFYDDDAFYSPEMMEKFQGIASSSYTWHQDSNIDVFERLDAI
ncbi:hypothetical protein ACS0TY_024813 [Phlomoides rotata]